MMKYSIQIAVEPSRVFSTEALCEQAVVRVREKWPPSKVPELYCVRHEVDPKW